MVHHRGSDLTGVHATGWYGRDHVFDESWRQIRMARQLPSKEIKKTTRLKSIRVVETPSVKVLWESSIGHMFLDRLGQMDIKQGQPILKGLQYETAEDKPDAERA